MCAAWATHEDACAPCNTYELTEDELDRAFLVASDVLFNLTERRWPGVCVDKVRPTARYRRHDASPRWWHATGDYRYGFCSCNRSRDFGCLTIPSIELPGRPVHADGLVVKVDGEVVEAIVYDRNKITRADGKGWPCCQNLLLPDTEHSTFSVEYPYGLGPPIGGVMACAQLGCQLALAFNPDALSDGACKLPKRVQTITRAGTTIAVIDPLTLFKDGLTGLSEVDLWVSSIRAGDKRRRGKLIIPGRRSTMRRMGV